MQITSPSYSFVKFDSPEPFNNCCDGAQDFCIPIVEETDIYFQFIATSSDYSEIQEMMAEGSASAFELLLLNGSGNTPENFGANILRDWTDRDGLAFERYRTGLFEVTFQWRSPLKDIKALVDCDSCFQLAIIRNGEFSGEFSDEFGDEFTVDGNTISYDYIAISNCFKRFCEDCFTTVMEFYNEDDYAGFNYCNLTNPINRVRLPFYLTQPKTVEDKAVYRKSNGAIRQTKSLLTKEYTVLTNHFPEWMHDKIAVALAHDNIYVSSGNYNGGVSKSGEYAIEWTDNICVAPASFKAMATPFPIRNNNCQDCKVVADCEEIAFAEFSLPDANLGDPYSYSLPFVGSLLAIISDEVKPAWMTIAIVGSNVQFTGTPDAEAIDVPVSFKLSNPCSETVTISKTINIDNMTPGMMLPWAGPLSGIPAGWMLIDGIPKSRVTYANLFAEIGTTHGAGDGSTTFDLPPAILYAPYNAADVDYSTIGNTGGAKTHTLTGDQQGSLKMKGKIDDAGGGSAVVIAGITINGQTFDKTGGSNQSSDGSEVTIRLNDDADEFDIRNPYYTIPYIIKY